jgi:hypothetical protein
VDEGNAATERDEQTPGDTGETVGQRQSVPKPRRKRVRGRDSSDRAAYLRSAPGWRKTRLGLILIALSMCSILLWLLISLFAPLAWAPLQYLLQALPLAGNLLCAFVPLKGAARTLTVANLGVIALGLALTLVADRMNERDESIARSEEPVKKATESDKEEQDLRKQLTDLRKKAAAGDKHAAKEEQELNRKLTELRNKRLADLKEESERTLAESKRTLAKLKDLSFWNWVYLQAALISRTIQIIILSFFIREIALALGDRDLARNCPRVAALALLTLALVLLGTILPLGVSFVHRLLGWILYLLGIVSYVWQGAQLVEACILIGNHLNPKST